MNKYQKEFSKLVKWDIKFQKEFQMPEPMSWYSSKKLVKSSLELVYEKPINKITLDNIISLKTYIQCAFTDEECKLMK